MCPGIALPSAALKKKKIKQVFQWKITSSGEESYYHLFSDSPSVIVLGFFVIVKTVTPHSVGGFF